MNAAEEKEPHASADADSAAEEFEPEVAPHAPVAPAGWYPQDDGTQRYWDGAMWLNVPEPPGGASLRTESRSTSPKRASKARLWLVVGIVAGAIVLASGALLIWKATSDAAAAEAAAVAAAEREADEKRIAENEAAAERAQEEKDDSERALRATSVTTIEESIKGMAEGHVAEGLIDGPVIEVTCSPVDGGSIDDLTDATTVFECFVANVDNGDGTMTGYYYNSTMNWTTGSYTYGMGAP